MMVEMRVAGGVRVQFSQEALEQLATDVVDQIERVPDPSKSRLLDPDRNVVVVVGASITGIAWERVTSPAGDGRIFVRRKKLR